MSNNFKTIEISTWTIAKFFLFILGLFFLYYIRNVVAFIFIVVILVAGFTPFVNWLVKLRIPRVIAVVILYFLIFVFFTFVIYLIIPPIIEQVTLLSTNINFYSEKLQNININISELLFQGRDVLSFVGNSLSQVSGGVFRSFLSLFGSAAAALTVFVLTFYILVQEDSIEKFILSLFPKKQQNHALAIYNKISIKLGKWLRGQLVLALIIGFTSYIILRILGIQYALSLAFLAGILEIVPIIGPIIAGLVVIGVAYLTGAAWWQIISIAISYVIVQQLEAHFLVPKMMGKAIGLSPIIVIIALMIGAQIGGIIGAVLAIPIAAGILVVIQQWPNLKKIK